MSGIPFCGELEGHREAWNRCQGMGASCVGAGADTRTLCPETVREFVIHDEAKVVMLAAWSR
jgi:hypothetical protein